MKDTFIVLHCFNTHQKVYIDALKIICVYYDGEDKCTYVQCEHEFSFSVDETADEVYEIIRRLCMHF